MNPLEAIPWRRAFVHAHSVCEETPLKKRVAYVSLVLLYTSLPVVALYAFAFSITWVATSSLTALFLLTVGDLNLELIQRLYCSWIEGVPGWLFDRGFRSIYNPPGNGSCFFKAVERGTGVSETEIRSDIADWIEANVAPANQIKWDQFKAQWGGVGEPEIDDVKTYANSIRMGELKIWGGHLEAQAIAEKQETSVWIHWEGADAMEHGAFDKRIDLYYTAMALGGNKNHYKLLLC